MPENDIYNNKGKYERFKDNLSNILEPVKLNDAKGKKHYYCKNKKNLVYFETLMGKFEARDLSFVRRLRLLNQLKLITFATKKNLKDCDRQDIDSIMKFMHERYKSPKSKADFVIDIKHIWKQLFPEKDERGQIDETITPYAVRHLSGKIDKSREKAKNDRLSYEEFERIVAYYNNNPKMQAYLTLALESLGRPQELLYLRLKDIEFYDNYAKIHLSEHGKEGIGILQCVDSFPYILKWYNSHPLNKDDNALLFIGDKSHKQLTPFSINKYLKTACKNISINKSVTCYSFKRNGVTFRRLAGESDLEIQHAARWTSSKQLHTYDKSTQEDAFKLALIRKGIVKDTSPQGRKRILETKVCSFCDEMVGFSVEICPKCKHFLDRGKIKAQIESTDKFQQQIQELTANQERMESWIKALYEKFGKQETA